MEKVLTQEEINALFNAAKGGKKSAGPDKKQEVTSCNFLQASQITKDEVRSVSMLHDAFARNLTHSLGAYLRVSFEVNLVSVEQLTYAEFLQRVPEVTYLASVDIRPLEVMAAVQLDLPLAFPIIDLLLGGAGKTEAQVRDITEIEEHILESVVKIICRELQATWQQLLELEFEFRKRQEQAQILRLMAPNEKILSLSFEIRMPEVRGMLNVAFPAMVSNALLRKLSQQWSYQKRRGPADVGERLRERVQECHFHVELRLPDSRVRVRDLVGLQPGQVLVLRHRVGDPALLLVAGKKLFTAHPVRSADLRGGQILQHLQISDESRRELK